MSDQEKNQPLSGLDAELEREIQDALGGKSLEDLLNEASPRPKEGEARQGPLAPGQFVKARIVSVDRQNVLVEIGPKDQGMIPLEQFEAEPARGDIVELEVSRYDRDEDMWVLSRHGAVERATWADLKEGQIIEGMIEGLNKGGLEVKFGGSIQGFMPLSQISIYRVEDASGLLGQKIRAQVIEVNRHEKRVIVSARAVMELEQEESRAKLMAELAEGDVRDGIVRQVMPYGAFVDMGGVDGLVHVSQLSYARVDDPAKVVQPGMKVKVKVLKIDKETGKISLGMKQVGPDPWDEIESRFPAGMTTEGLVTRLADFGAFCQLTPGVEGLIPIGEITWTQRLRHPSDMLKVGETVSIKVLAVDLERKRISLSIKQALANPWSGAAQRYPVQGEIDGTVKRLAEFGAFIELEPGVEGLAHISELSEERVRKVEDVLQVGQAVRAKVLEVDEAGRRISLTIKNVLQAGQELPAVEIGSAAPAAPKKRKTPLKGGLE